MDDVFTRWPHARVAEIYRLFADPKEDPVKIRAGAAVLELVQTYIDHSSTQVPFADPVHPNTLEIFGLTFKWRHVGLIHIEDGSIDLLPSVIKEVLNIAFEPHAIELGSGFITRT